jgi:GNAT superfamily N-acetyltransferase
MTILFRKYQHPDDYQKISDFLIIHHQTGNLDGNWIQPAWEYMHFHSLLDQTSLEKIGIWEVNERIVAVAHYEWRLGEAFFQFHPAYRNLRVEMLNYAEENLASAAGKDGAKTLCAYINDFDHEFIALVKARGYEQDFEATRPLYCFNISDPIPSLTLPEGFRLTNLAEEPDWAKVHRALYRGFNHPDDPSMTDEDLEDRRRMFDTPTARRDLKIAVSAPNGDFVAFCGMFYEPANKFAYVEPVATDPHYRRLGLGKAAVLEGIQRCAGLGAEIAYVGSDQEFYKSLGFNKVYNSECWIKRWL